MEKELIVSGVALDKNVAKIALFDVPDKPGIAYKLFNALAEENINVDMIIQSHERHDINDISFTVTRDDMNKAVAKAEMICREIGAKKVVFNDQVAKVSIVGAGMKTNPGVAAMMFEALYGLDINIQMIATSEIKVSCIIAAEAAEAAVKALHQKFELENLKQSEASAS